MADDPSNYFALQGSVHIVSFAEYTLCGTALEGDEGDSEGMYLVPQKVTCERCVEIIEFVKSIPNKYHRKRKRPSRTNRFDRLEEN